MMQLLLVGAFHEMIELCEDAGYSILGIIDNNYSDKYLGYSIVGKDEDADSIHTRFPNCPVVISPDKPHMRKQLVDYYRSFGFSFATIIHPSASISRYAKIGEGAVIQRGVNVSANSSIGAFCKLNAFCNVMHDCQIADYSTIAPNAVILGRVTVGSLSYVGANCTILPNHRIGSEVTVGAGSVLTKDIDSHLVVAGVPAGVLKTSNDA